VLAQILSW